MPTLITGIPLDVCDPDGPAPSTMIPRKSEILKKKIKVESSQIKPIPNRQKMTCNSADHGCR